MCKDESGLTDLVATEMQLEVTGLEEVNKSCKIPSLLSMRNPRQSMRANWSIEAVLFGQYHAHLKTSSYQADPYP